MDQVTISIIAAALAVAAWIALLHVRRRHRRAAAARAPFPEAWRRILDENVALYRRVPDELREQLHRDINIFLAEKEFEGCGGLDVTEEMKVIIACEACLLLLNRENDNFPTLNTILIYPHPYIARQRRAAGSVIVDEPTLRGGESWTGGDLVLAWDCVEKSASRDHAPGNVVIHEFAHQLDQEDGAADGAPLLGTRSRYISWADVLGREFEELKSRVARHRSTVLDPYGATHPAEFFAVATETFFTRPETLHTAEPELYRELSHFYRLDPVAWNGTSARHTPQGESS